MIIIKKEITLTKIVVVYLCLFLCIFLYSTTLFAGPNLSPVLSKPNIAIIEVIIGLLMVVSLILCLAWIMKRIGYTGVHQNGFMKVKACLPLSSKEKVFLIEVGDEQVILGVAPGFVGHIKSLKSPIEYNNDVDVSDFSKTLKKIINGKE